MYNDVIYLITEGQTTINSAGDPVSASTEKAVFAEIKSIGMNEFYQAQASGLKPEVKFVIADYYDYGNEKKLKYNNEIYNILRTYRNGIQLEITAYRGVNNGSS